MKILVGTYTKRKSKGIYEVDLDLVSKDYQQVNLVIEVNNPTYLTTSGGSIFTIAQNENRGGLAYYENYQFMSQDLFEEKPPCYVSYDDIHDLLFSANYHHGNIKCYKLHYKYINHVQTISYEAGSHAHFIEYIPSLDKVFVCDLGLDKILIYDIDSQEKLQLKTTVLAPKASGPRHLVAHPSKPIVYVVTEYSYQILVLALNDQGYHIIQEVAGSQDQIIKDQHGAAIRVSKDGKYLYSTNRKDNSISVFHIDESGLLTHIQQISTMGNHPRDFNISLDQESVVVANMESDSLSIFDRDIYTGKLKFRHSNIEVYEPVCVVFKK